MARRTVAARHTRSWPSGRAATNVAWHADGSRPARASATEATSKNGLGSDPRVGLEALDDLVRDGVAEHALDVAQQPQLVDADE